MRVIKRYPNRKLYDTARKRYVTLERVEDLVRQGEEVRVVDSRTGGDLTNATLGRILADQQKRRAGLPQSILAGIVRQGGRIRDAIRDRLDGAMAGRVEAVIRRLGLPTRREVEALEKKIAGLERKLAKLSRSRR